MKKQLLTLAFIVAAMAISHAQGGIIFANNIASRVLIDPDGAGPQAAVLVPAGAPIVYGVFWGPAGTPADGLQLNSGTLGAAHPTLAGIIQAPSYYIVEGATQGSTVSLQIRAWSASFGRDWQAARNTVGAVYGETDVRQVRVLFGGAGAVIWQSSAGTAPDRFYPMVLNVPEPSSIGLLALGVASLLLFRRRR